MANDAPVSPQPVIQSERLPSRSELLWKDRTDNPELIGRLTLRGPADLDHVPPTLAFNRLREVSLPWDELMAEMAKIGGGTGGASRALQRYFETSWWTEPENAPSQEQLQALFADGNVIVLPEELPEGQVTAHAFHRHERVKKPKEEDKPQEWEDKAAPVTEGVILRDAISGRHYLIATYDPVTDPAALQTPEGYVAFWQDNVSAAMVIGASAEEALGSFSSYEELDLRAVFIERRYDELMVFKEVADAIDTKVAGALDSLLELGMGRDLDFSAFEAVQERYVNARLGPERIERELKQLKRQAQDMGYLLFLPGEPNMTLTFPDKTTTTAVAGDLYRLTSKKCEWTVWYPKAIAGNFFEDAWFGIKRFFGGAKERPTKDWPDPKSDWFDDYEKVDTWTDKLAQTVQAYRSEQKQVFVFEETPAGYVTRDGTALTTVMARCRFDEAFRQDCVVMLPIFEQGFSIVKPVVGYHVFKRPLPGLVPMRMPRLFLSESLSYRTSWKGTELGELVSAINLTPGEEREMTITRSITRETTSNRTTSSVIELASSETSDLSTEMERIAKVDNEFTAHADSEVTVGSSKSDKSGLKGIVEGLTSVLSTVTTGNMSSTVKYGASDTLKLFSQTMNRVARKAATSVSRNNRQEISTSTTETTTVSSTDSTVIKLANINKGRTLNLMFYRVYNRYAAGLYIDDLRFGVTEGTELIAGSGIYNTRSFQPNQLGRLLGLLEVSPLPFDMGEKAKLHFQNKVLDTLLVTLDAEYLEDPAKARGLVRAAMPGAEPEEEAEEEGRSADVLLAPAGLLAAISELHARAAPRKNAAPEVPTAEALAERIAALDADFANIRLKSRPLGGSRDGASDLLVAAQGLYLDSMLGARPATEPYSEEMRTQEIRKSAAEVLRAEADAEYTRAQARRIAVQPTNGGGGNVLTGVHMLDDPRVLTLGFLLPLSAGDWVVCDNGTPVPGGEIPAGQLHRTTVVLKPPRTAARSSLWASPMDLMSRITVRNRQTEDEIGPT